MQTVAKTIPSEVLFPVGNILIGFCNWGVKEENYAGASSCGNHYPEGEDPSNEIPGTGTVNNPG